MIPISIRHELSGVSQEMEIAKSVHEHFTMLHSMSQKDYEEKWLRYLRMLKDRGYCANCEQKLQECFCVVLTTSEKPIG